MRPLPFRIAPIFAPRIWGVKALAPLFPEKSQLAEPIGEAWLTARESGLLKGPFAGETLGSAWKRMPAEWKGESAAGETDFPLLAKFIFPSDKLSVQVHPDDEYAQKHESAAGERGKTEMWYVASAEPDAAVWIGLRSGVSPESFRRAIADGTAEALIERVPVKAGDAIFCPAGTVHFIGPGMTLCEIQQYSDLTYRIFDFNRTGPGGKPRALHLEKAFDVIRFGKQKGGKVEPVGVMRGRVETTLLAACRYFAVERQEFAEPFLWLSSPRQFELRIVLEGRGQIESGGAQHNYAAGQAWFFPAGEYEFRLVPEAHTKMIRAFIPRSVDDLIRDMSMLRIPQSSLSRVVFP